MLAEKEVAMTSLSRQFSEKEIQAKLHETQITLLKGQIEEKDGGIVDSNRKVLENQQRAEQTINSFNLQLREKGMKLHSFVCYPSFCATVDTYLLLSSLKTRVFVFW